MCRVDRYSTDAFATINSDVSKSFSKDCLAVWIFDPAFAHAVRAHKNLTIPSTLKCTFRWYIASHGTAYYWAGQEVYIERKLVQCHEKAR